MSGNVREKVKEFFCLSSFVSILKRKTNQFDWFSFVCSSFNSFRWGCSSSSSLIGNKLRFSQELFALLCVVCNFFFISPLLLLLLLHVNVCICLLPAVFFLFLFLCPSRSLSLFLQVQSNYARLFYNVFHAWRRNNNIKNQQS